MHTQETYHFTFSIQQYLAFILIAAIVLVSALGHPMAAFAEGESTESESTTTQESTQQSTESESHEGDSGSTGDTGSEGEGGAPSEEEPAENGEDTSEETAGGETAESGEGESAAGTEDATDGAAGDNADSGSEEKQGAGDGEASVIETGKASSDSTVTNGANINDTSVENDTPPKTEHGGSVKTETESEESTAGTKTTNEGTETQTSSETKKETSEVESDGSGSHTETETKKETITKEEHTDAQEDNESSESSQQTSSNQNGEQTDTETNESEKTSEKDDVTQESSSEESSDTDSTKESAEQSTKSEEGSSESTKESTTTTEEKESELEWNAVPQTGGNVTVENGNTLASANDALAAAQSGLNTAADPDGAYIFSGDAESFGTLVSLFNVAITNSTGNLLLLQNPVDPILDLTNQFLGVFGDDSDAEGDSECSLLGCNSTDAKFNILTENVAEIKNKLVVRSGTGGNAAESSEGTAGVVTGNATAAGNVINFGNLQIIDSRYLVILMNKLGNLSGDIVLPPAKFFSKLSSSANVDGGSSFVTENDADIENKGDARADTGENEAAGEERAEIHTGDANAQSRVHNFINQNAIGGRPICFVVSIGGNWSGDIVGLPDGFSHEKTQFGHFVCGKGGSENTRELPENFNATTTNYAKILNEVLVEATTGGNKATGTDAYIETGDADAFLQILNVVNQNIIGQDWVFALFTITGNWSGDLMFGSQDFWDEVQRKLDARTFIDGARVHFTEESNLEIEKNASIKSFMPPMAVHYTISVTNTGGPAYHAELFDTLRGPEGEIVNQETWWLDTIPAGETIEVSYTMDFATSTPTGLYENSAQVKAITRNPSVKPFYGTFGHSDTVHTTVEARERETKEKPAVGGEEYYREDVQCPQYLSDYIGRGGSNDPEQVTLLQTFLRYHQGYENVRETGEYDSVTFQAVQDFQDTYESQILVPWGIANPTGYVYYTTRKHINELACDDGSEFPLSDEQKREMEQFRARVEDARKKSTPEPDTSRVGQNDDEETNSSELAETTPSTPDRTMTAAAAQALAPATEQQNIQSGTLLRDMMFDLRKALNVDKLIQSFLGDELTRR